MCEGRRVMAAVISYNRKEQLERTIEAVLAQSDAKCDLLVFDNGSTDGTQEMVKSRYASNSVQLCDLGVNTGCAGGIHLAVFEGALRGYDRIWIMDDDVVPERDALLELLRADEELSGNFGFLSSAAYWKDGSLCKANIQKKGVFSFVGGADYDDGPVRILMASICSLYLNVDAVREVGLPIAEYFFYTEDYEYTSRIARRQPGYLVPRSKVRHDMAVNAKASIVDDTADRMWRYEYLYRNDVNCYRKLGPAGWAYLAAKAGYTTVDILLRARENRVAKLRTLWKGLADGARFNPEIEYVTKAGE